MQMKINRTSCPGCGAPVQPGARFCENCGASLTAEAPASLESHDAHSSFSAAGDAQLSQVTCPGCGEPLPAGKTVCPSCGATYYVTTFNSIYDQSFEVLRQYASGYNALAGSDPNNVYALFSQACCQLRLRNYAKAKRAFGQVIDLGGFTSDDSRSCNAEVYLYHAVCLMHGTRGGSLDLDVARQIEDDIANGINIETLPGLYLLWAMLQRDCYEMRGLSVSPSSAEIMGYARTYGASDADWDRLNDLVYGQ